MLSLNNSVWACYNIFPSFLLWMFCSELVLSFACVYFVVTGHSIPVWGLSILRANLASTEKVRLEKSSSLYLGSNLALSDAEGILITATDWPGSRDWDGWEYILENLSCLGPLLAGCVVDYEQSSHEQLT